MEGLVTVSHLVIMNRDLVGKQFTKRKQSEEMVERPRILKTLLDACAHLHL